MCKLLQYDYRLIKFTSNRLFALIYMSCQSGQDDAKGREGAKRDVNIERRFMQIWRFFATYFDKRILLESTTRDIIC